MNILFIAPYVPSPIRVRPYQLIRELSRRHEITVLTTDSPGAQPDVDALRAVCRRVEFVPMSRGAMARACALAALRGEPLQSAVCQSPRLERCLAELLEAEHFDVVHVEHLRAARLERLVPPTLPKVYDAVDCISLLLARTLHSSHSPRQRLQALVELRRTRIFEGHLLGRFHEVIVTSPDDSRALAALPGSRGAAITVIPNGVDLEAFRPLEGGTEPATLVLSGKMSYHANVTAAVHFVRDILPLVRARRPDARLVIAGSNPPALLRELAARSGGAITVTGYVKDLRDAVGPATVAVCPVRVKVGIQNKVLEAMALAVPVVTTRIGAEGLSAVDGQDLLVGDTPREFADHVLKLLARPGLRDAIGRNGRLYVQAHHRWGAAAVHLEEAYARAATQPSAMGQAAREIRLNAFLTGGRRVRGQSSMDPA